jgi:hypothetical protein
MTEDMKTHKRQSQNQNHEWLGELRAACESL